LESRLRIRIRIKIMGIRNTGTVPKHSRTCHTCSTGEHTRTGSGSRPADTRPASETVLTKKQKTDFFHSSSAKNFSHYLTYPYVFLQMFRLK
jgi:hypothetical protein